MYDYTNKYSELIIKANEQIKEVCDWLKEHEEAFHYLDLKLHDVYYYCYSEMEKDFPLCYAMDNGDSNYTESYFYMFCEASYNQMTDYFAEEKIEFIRRQLGRTSSFYLYDGKIVEINTCGRRYYGIDFSQTLYNAMYELYCSSVYLDFDDNGEINTECIECEDEEEFIDYYKPELEYIINDLYEDFTKHFEDTLKVYDYIKDFKENQVEYFKEWLQFYEDELEGQKKKEEEYEQRRQDLIAQFKSSVLREILNKYVTSCNDLEKLLKEMNA